MGQKTIKWNLEKNRKLQEAGGISFEEIATLIQADTFYLVKHPNKPHQKIAVVMIGEYPWDVPFVVEEEGSIFLKTAFPNRKGK